MATQGTVTFPGLRKIRGATITFSHGITPSVATVNIMPQDLVIKDTGNLVFGYGRRNVTLKDCKIDRASIKTSGGRIVSVKILDRRWKWRFGEISGWYNQRNKEGLLFDRSNKTPKELIELCLDEMGETNRTIKGIPDKIRPEVKWENDNPAVMLDNLCQLFGCRVALDLNDKVLVGKIGDGEELPGGPIESDSLGLDSPEAPDEVKAVCGPSRFENLFLCEAVGLDNDFTVKLIDDLSYKPEGGWVNEHPDEFPGIKDEKDRELALRTVFKWYRIKSNPKGGLELEYINHGEGGRVQFIDDILPLENVRVETYAGGETPGKSKPAEAFGSNYNLSGGGSANTRRTTSIEPGTFTIDGPTGIVKFRDQQWFINSDFKSEALTDLVILCAHPHREEDGTYERHSTDKKTGENRNTKTLVVKRADIRAEYIGIEIISDIRGATAEGDRLIEFKNNTDEIDAELNATIDDKIASFKFTNQQTRTYRDLIEISPDGKISQITWNVGGGGTTTTVSLNQEHTFGDKEKERRRKAREQHIADQNIPIGGGIHNAIQQAVDRGI